MQVKVVNKPNTKFIPKEVEKTLSWEQIYALSWILEKDDILEVSEDTASKLDIIDGQTFHNVPVDDYNLDEMLGTVKANSDLVDFENSNTKRQEPTSKEIESDQVLVLEEEEFADLVENESLYDMLGIEND